LHDAHVLTARETLTSLLPQPVHRRGKKGKSKKLRGKYADQDEDERRLRMELLGHKEPEEKYPQTKGKTDHHLLRTNALSSLDACFHAFMLPYLTLCTTPPASFLSVCVVPYLVDDIARCRGKITPEEHGWVGAVDCRAEGATRIAKIESSALLCRNRRSGG